MKKKKVLILYDYFDPAYKAGGPIRSLVNLVSLVENELDIYVLTTNQDHDGIPLDIKADRWIIYCNKTKVKYLSKSNHTYAILRTVIDDLEPDVVYINGIFSLFFVVYALKILRKRKDTKVVIAPRGMLQPEALAIKPLKKKIYLSFLQLFCLERMCCGKQLPSRSKMI